ncbi:aspartate/glutamate racemase family protein [Facilibium subflavum]|uniref:aspartate/glutamate racemase family protein n=1 Tax=Facilibium subflavum TaxID=2219058 RepID=UPI000E65BE9D|nr:amino acid racemase [Facilibium subflavum]
MIGVLAGMGPMSTAPFVDQLMRAWQQHYDVKYDIEFPHVLIYSLPTPFYMDQSVDHEALEGSIKKGLLKLESYGVDLIAMPCNTAHFYFKSLQSSISIKLLNMIDSTVFSIPKTLSKVTLLATRITFASQLYQQALATQGYWFVFDLSWQTWIDQIIIAVKNSNETQAAYIASQLIKAIKAKGVECVIIGCTDLSQIIKRVSEDQFIVDSSACLVRSIIETYDFDAIS